MSHLGRRALVLRYSAFAAIATLANLGAQRLVMYFGTDLDDFGLALICGTGVGLVVKYLLDKRWIFADEDRGLRAHGRKFTLYTAMGLITTAIFWISETIGWWVWRTQIALEAGAVLGLAVGYVVKYQLDKRFVFAPRPATEDP